MTRPSSLRTGFWTVLLLGCLAWTPAAYPGYWQGLEGFVPVFNAAQPNALANIATVPDLWRGMGNATFLLARPFLAVNLDATTAVRLTFVLCFVLGGLGMYAWLRAGLGDRAAGLAGLIYTLSPVCLATVYVRGSLSEAMIMGLLPVALAGIAAHAQGRSPGAAGIAVIAILWMWRTQAGLALFASVLLLLYALLVERQWVTGLVVAVSGLAGLTSLIPLWSIRTTTPVIFHEHFVHWFQLFKGDWQTATSIPGWQDNYPFQLGFVGVIFSAVTLWRWVRPAAPQPSRYVARLLRFSVGSVIICVALSLHGSAELWQWSGAERLLTYPWQLLLLAAPLLAVTAGSLAYLDADLGDTTYWTLLVALVVLGSYGNLTPKFTLIHPPETPIAVIGATRNFVILEARLTEQAQPPGAILE
ncbi:MAG: hypothetical protein M3Q45_02040, partial [Chloroflexota bacterium]|nr:hypothetical protein [Chloroflexota bacterium]